MITQSISFRIAGGKNAAAMTYLRGIADRVAGHGGEHVRILVQVGGPMGRVLLISEFSDFAAYQANRTKIMADADFQAQIANAADAGLFLPGSVESALFEVAAS